jgi:hypothetical protein
MTSYPHFVQLTRDQRDYLSKRFPGVAQQITPFSDSRGGLQLDEAQERNLLGLLADRLQEVGFDGEYKPTNEGRMLESIIDALTLPERRINGQL